MNTTHPGLPQVQLAYLADHPCYVQEVGHLKHEQWRHTSPNRLYEVWIDEIRDSARADGFPMTLIALQGTTLVGFVTLIVLDDRAGIQDGLWLITLYVKESRRRQGIGERLIDRCVDEMRRAGYRALYLWTEFPELTRYYACRGWRRIGKDGDGDEIMIYELGPA